MLPSEVEIVQRDVESALLCYLENLFRGFAWDFAACFGLPLADSGARAADGAS